jgi:hypothetical protein
VLFADYCIPTSPMPMDQAGPPQELDSRPEVWSEGNRIELLIPRKQLAGRRVDHEGRQNHAGGRRSHDSPRQGSEPGSGLPV